MSVEPNYPWARRRKEIEYRGLRMEVVAQNREGGHRHQVHQYFGYDDPYTETFGLRARTYSFLVKVAGDNYDQSLQRHIDVFEKVGRGRLSLWHGKDVFVVCRRWRIIERSDEAGLAKITVEFVDAGDRVPPGLDADSITVVGALVKAAKSNVIAAFVSIAGNVAVIERLATAMADLGSAASTALQFAMDEMDAAAGFAEDMMSKVVQFNDDVQSLATDALSLGIRVSDLYDELLAVGDDAERRFRAVKALAFWKDTLSPVPEVATSIGQFKAANQDAFGVMVEQMAALHLAEIALMVSFVSSQEAAALRDELAESLDRSILEAGNAGADELFIQLRSVKSAAVVNLDRTAARLPQRVVLVLSSALSSLALSYRLYGDTSRARTLAKANAVRHPGFVPAATELEVLSPDSRGT